MKLLDEKAPAFGIKNLKMVSFSAQRGYGYKYTATDVAVAVNAILELSGRKDPELNFHTGFLNYENANLTNNFIAMEALRVDRMKEVLAGIELGKKQLRAVMNTINSNIEMGTVINAGPFLYMLLKGKIQNYEYIITINIMKIYYCYLFINGIKNEFVTEGNPEHHMFSHPSSIRLLGKNSPTMYTNLPLDS